MEAQNKQRIYDELDALFPDAGCELNHKNPFQLLVAVMLSAQTTDVSVNKVTPALFAAYPSAKELSEATEESLQDYIRSIGLYRNKARSIKKMAQILVEKYDGEVPNDYRSLVALPGVGRKTANVVMAEAFGVPAIAVDTHVARISKRLGFADRDDPVIVIEDKLMAEIPEERWIKMHHQLIHFGRYRCRAKNPDCHLCHLIDICQEDNKKV